MYTDCDTHFLSYRASKIRLWLKVSLSLWSAKYPVILSLQWRGTGKTTKLRAQWTSRSLSKQDLLALWFVKPFQRTVEDLPALLPIRLGVSALLATYMWKVSIFTESYNCLSWKRPLRALISTINPKLPSPLLNQIPKRQIYMSLKYLQGGDGI